MNILLFLDFYVIKLSNNLIKTISYLLLSICKLIWTYINMYWYLINWNFKFYKNLVKRILFQVHGEWEIGQKIMTVSWIVVPSVNWYSSFLQLLENLLFSENLSYEVTCYLKKYVSEKI